MQRNLQTLSNSDLQAASDRIELVIYKIVASIYGVIPLAVINHRDEIDAEIEKRG